MAGTEHQLAALGDVIGEFDRASIDYWLFGGFAVDFHVGRVTRPHGDVDLAVRADDRDAIAALLLERGWAHRPNPDENGGTGFERDGVRLELTFVALGEGGAVSILFRDHAAVWSEEPFGDETRALLGVRARVLPLELLKRDKSMPRAEPEQGAVDRADFAALSKLQ